MTRSESIAAKAPTRVAPSTVTYAPDLTITTTTGEVLEFCLPRHSPHWYTRLRAFKRWASVDSPAGIELTRPPSASVKEVAREDRTLDIVLTIRVTTPCPDLARVVALVRDSLDAGPNHPMEFLDGDISALGTTFTINDWWEVRRG